VDTVGPQKYMATKEHVEKRSGERNGHSGFRYSWRKMEATVQDRAGWRQVVSGRGRQGLSKDKGKAYLYSINETSPQGAQVWITQGCPCKLHHNCLYLANVRQMAPPERQTSDSARCYSFIDPGRMKGWVGLVGWPIAELYPHKWSHIRYRSSGGRGKFACQRPTF